MFGFTFIRKITHFYHILTVAVRSLYDFLKEILSICILLYVEYYRYIKIFFYKIKHLYVTTKVIVVTTNICVCYLSNYLFLILQMIKYNRC